MYTMLSSVSNVIVRHIKATLCRGVVASRPSISITGIQGRLLESFRMDRTESIFILYFYNMVSVMDELGNENQLATLSLL